jgi:DNA-binding transcriptional MerR regulator
MNIKTLAQATGVSSATIRYYETEGILPAPPRQLNGYRLYSADYVDRLNQIKLCQSLGFKLDEIQQLMPTEQPKEHDLILSKLAEKKAITQDLIDQLEDKLKKLSAMHEILSKSWGAGHCLTANEISHLIDA